MELNQGNINYDDADQVINAADLMWKALKSLVKSTPSFEKKSDNDKLAYFRDDMKCKDYINEFPIVCRYMICMGQYSRKAFRRFLDKIKIDKKTTPPADQRPKGYMEDLWLKQQAYYVRYLWESFQKSHFSVQKAQQVWRDAYTSLKGEIDDFRNKHEEIKEQVEKEKLEIKSEIANDFVNHVCKNPEAIDPQDMRALHYVLKGKQYRRWFTNCLKDMLTRVSLVPHSCGGVGVVPVEPEEDNKAKVVMIETVSDENYEKIPEEFKMSEDERKRYARMTGGDYIN